MLGTKTNILTKQKEISIFKTSINDEKDIQIVKGILDVIVGKNKWNFDLEDVDNILRIYSNTRIKAFLIQELYKLGYKCEELN